MMAGTGVRGDEVLTEQAKLLMHAGGTPEDLIQENAKAQKAMFDILKTTANREEAEKKYKEAMSGFSAAIKDAAFMQMNSALSPWMRYFVTYDPQSALEKVKCPVLALDGEKDLQVSPRQNLPAIEKALRAGGNKDFKVVELPGLNHLFQTCKTGTVAEYGEIEETMSPAALDLISGWIAQHSR
jgi:uncharacterized protein